MKKILSVILLCGMTFTIAACNRNASDEDAQTIVNKFLVEIAGKTVEYKAGSIALSGKGTLEAKSSDVALEGNADVIFDSTDASNSKSAITFDLEATGNLEGQSGKIGLAGEIRNIGGKMYFYIKDLSVDSDDPTTSMMAGMFGGFLKDKWNELPGAVEPPDTGSMEVQNVSIDQMKIIAGNNPFLTVEKDLGDRNFEVKVDVAKLKNYLKELGEANETPTTTEALGSIDSMFESLGDYSLQLQIDEDYELEHFKADIKVDDPEKNQQLTVNIDASLDGDTTEGTFDMAVSGDEPAKIHLEGKADHTSSRSETIEVPADAKIFDLNEITGGLLGGGMMAPDEGMLEMEGMSELEGMTP